MRLSIFRFNPEQYHSIKPYVIDNEPAPEKERLNDLNDPYRLFRCRTIMNCTEVCPKGLVPSRVIEKIRLMMVKDSL